MVLQGLQTRPLDSILDFVKANGFNALRMPFAMETVLRNPSNLHVSCELNPDICHMNALNMMDAYIDK
jgi:aryl-phospho-beta-D-glucosidase BglC (GH1 family)